MKAGAPAVFCRFAGCNLWSGREQDRGKAVCQFCDTDFVGIQGVRGGKYTTPTALSRAIETVWPVDCWASKLVVCTGGELLLQLDQKLVCAFHNRGHLVAVETNGTFLFPIGVDWICVNPQSGTALRCLQGNELKLIFPQKRIDLQEYAGPNFNNFLLQPMYDPCIDQNMAAAAEYYHRHSWWRLSLQVHKFANLR